MAENEETKVEGAAQAGPVDLVLLEKVLDVVRPSLQADGGDCNLMGVDENGVVTLELIGACSGCPLSSITLGMGIERILKQHVPGVTKVDAVMGDTELPNFDDELFGW
ncbi:MAG: NifU family protein [Atopobiaceae bacterium]|nr:NifU family protein [Atopobiaceae bacterium]